MNNKLTDVQESIMILCTLQALLDEYRKCLFKEKKNTDSVIYSIIVNQIVLTSCSYLDEWEVLGKLSSKNSKVKELRKLAKPAINRINEWSDMKYVRNSVIAHNHRIQKDKYSPVMFTEKRELRCPNTFHDYRLLMGCIYLTKNVLIRLFTAEYNEMVPQLKNLDGFRARFEIKTERSYEKQFDKITKEVQLNLDKYNNYKVASA